MLKNNKKAFSLIELSIVILIIGIIIAGITQSSRLVELYRLSSARTQTDSSPVNSMKGLVVWYEATSEASFDERETDNYADLSAAEQTLLKGRITTWYDISSSKGRKDNLTQSTDAAKPKYFSDCINSLPCVDFDGVNDLLTFGGSSIGDIAGTNYTIFIVEKNGVAGAEAILGSSSAETLHIGYGATTTMSWGHISGSYVTIDPASVTLENNDPVLHTFVNESIDGFGASLNADFYYYANGSATAESGSEFVQTSNGVSNAVGAVPTFANATLGSGSRGGTVTYYDGGIGEVIIFSRALQSQERNAVEDYLIKKWQIKPDNS